MIYVLSIDLESSLASQDEYAARDVPPENI